MFPIRVKRLLSGRSERVKRERERQHCTTRQRSQKQAYISLSFFSLCIGQWDQLSSSFFSITLAISTCSTAQLVRDPKNRRASPLSFFPFGVNFHRFPSQTQVVTDSLLKADQANLFILQCILLCHSLKLMRSLSEESIFFYDNLQFKDIFVRTSTQKWPTLPVHKILCHFFYFGLRRAGEQ